MARYVTLASANTMRISAKHGDPALTTAEQMVEMLTAGMAQVWSDRPDLVLFPENCDIPNNYNYADRIAYITERGSYVADRLGEIARERNCWIAYPTCWVFADGTIGNIVHMIDRQGKIAATYQKNYLTLDEYRQGKMLFGDAPILVETDFATVSPIICFDLTYKELRDAVAALEPELILYPSAAHGGLMQQQWALDTGAWLLTSIPNQPSGIVNPLGEAVAMTTNYRPWVTGTVNIDCAVVHYGYYQAKLLQLKNDLGPDVSVHDPGRIGLVLVISNGNRSAKDLLKEYEIPTFREYYRMNTEERRLGSWHKP